MTGSIEHPTSENPKYWAVRRLVIAVVMGVVGLAAPVSILSQGAAAVAGDGGHPATRPGALPGRLRPFNTEGLLVPADRLLSGGPGKDGIPALTNPNRVPVAQAAFLSDQQRVIGVTLHGESRAYPIGVLNWHEIINDELGVGASVPIAVIYCPLCDSASVVDRRLDGQTYEFGVSGLLHNSNVVLFDRTDQALWSQVGLTAISGPNRGRSLTHLVGWTITTFGDWKARHADSTVVTFDTGYRRAYGRNPYSTYFATDKTMFPLDHTDHRFKNKEPVIGIRWGGATRAYPVALIRGSPNGEVRDRINGQPVRIRVDPTTGAARVIQAPDGSQVVHTFWFAWVAFHPETGVYGAG